MTIQIIGAGMAGLLAANVLRNHKPLILESQPQLPNNHSAVLRFRTSAVGDLLGIPFRKVKMMKGHVPWRNPVADAMAYSRKTTGISRSDRSIASSGMDVHDRFIAPPDLIQHMANGQKIEFNHSWDGGNSEKTISTMPMPQLMDHLGYQDKPNFGCVHGYNVRATLVDCDAHVSLYVPSPELPFSRISITGNQLILEFSCCNLSMEETQRAIDSWKSDKLMETIALALDLLGFEGLAGFPTIRLQRYAKILPIDDRVRKDFMFYATDKFGIYSLGRFATWRPGLMVDDLVNDLRLINGWLGTGGSYATAKHR